MSLLPHRQADENLLPRLGKYLMILCVILLMIHTYRKMKKWLKSRFEFDTASNLSENGKI
jgi:hypothetical protein